MRRFPILAALFCLCLFAALAGCGGAGNRAMAPPLDVAMDISERAPGSLAFDVVDYRWNYLHDGAHIRLKGTARNNSGAPLQAVMLEALLFDQDGRLLARGASYLAPAYLKPGATGEFEIVALAGRDKGVVNTRLVSNCRTSAF